MRKRLRLGTKSRAIWLTENTPPSPQAFTERSDNECYNRLVTNLVTNNEQNCTGTKTFLPKIIFYVMVSTISFSFLYTLLLCKRMLFHSFSVAATKYIRANKISKVLYCDNCVFFVKCINILREINLLSINLCLYLIPSCKRNRT